MSLPITSHSRSSAPLGPRSRPPRQPHRRPWIPLVTGALIVAAGIWWGWPRIQLHTSRTGLARVSTSGWMAHVTSVSVHAAGGGSIPVRLVRGRIWPQHTVASSLAVTVRVNGVGLAGFSVHSSTVVHTPPAPQLTQTHIAVPLHQTLKLHWSTPVARVLRQSSPPMTFTPATSVTAIGPMASQPGVRGTVTVSAAARTWETPGKSAVVQWQTVPWLSGQIVPVSANQPTTSTTPLTVHWSQSLGQPNLRNWVLSPSIPGHWNRVTAQEYRFQPTASGWAPGTQVQLTIPAGTKGPMSAQGSYLQHRLTQTWQVTPGYTMRLQAWLAELGYLPLRYIPGSGSQTLSGWSAAYHLPAGQFQWRYAHTPPSLTALWHPGQWNVITQGAIMTFERQNHLTVNGIPGPQVWSALRHAVVQHQVAPFGYSYIYVSETLPERLTLWQNGHVVLQTLANTGIPATPTYLGTFPIFERLPFQIMRGKNPNGVPYADPVSWINYFKGSDAVHGFVRAHYGFPQSLGCVEVPPSVAKKLYPQLHLGTLVTVEPPGSPSSP